MWDERYSADGYLFGTKPAAFLEAHADQLVEGQMALAVADGEGRNGVFLAQQGLEVTTIDASEVGVAKAKALADLTGVSLDVQLADVLAYGWPPEAFDLVVGIFIQFVGPEDRSKIFEGMKQTLRPGGRLLLHGYRPEQLAFGTGGPPVAENMYTEDLLAESFADLTIERLESYDAEIEEGTGHVGMSALIDLVATKP